MLPARSVSECADLVRTFRPASPPLPSSFRAGRPEGSGALRALRGVAGGEGYASTLGVERNSDPLPLRRLPAICAYQRPRIRYMPPEAASTFRRCRTERRREPRYRGQIIEPPTSNEVGAYGAGGDGRHLA